MSPAATTPARMERGKEEGRGEGCIIPLKTVPTAEKAVRMLKAAVRGPARAAV